MSGILHQVNLSPVALNKDYRTAISPSSCGRKVAESKWVGTEPRSYLRRRVDDDSLRIIPIMLDDTPLPLLVADYKGYKVSEELPIEEIAEGVLGFKPDNEIARLLQARLLELTDYGGGEY